MKIKGREIHLDTKSLKFKLCVYFGLFAAFLLLMLWFFQIIFLNTYYQEMKIKETQKIASTIISEYGHENFLAEIIEIIKRNDLSIQIEAAGSDSKTDLSFSMPLPLGTYEEEMAEIKETLLESGANHASAITSNPMRNTDMLAYCAYLDKTEGAEVLLYIFSPLYPVESTISILSSQLRTVTIISLIVALVASLYISLRVTKPLETISTTAEELAEGNYGIIFEGGHYSEIIQLADTLTYTSSELAKAANMQKDLLANVSHDLRTPLTMVKSYAEMIRDLSGNNPEKRNSHLNVIIDEADRLNLLVNDILEVSKIQSGKETLTMTTFPLRDTIETLIQSYSLLSEKEGLLITFNNNGRGIIRGDESKLKQVLTNLINNAIKFSDKDKRIDIMLIEADDFIRCEVTDHGAGISKKDLKNIWDRYYKASGNHKRTGEGSGLGLSIVKEILTLHGANFGVESQLGRGSTFWFELEPISKES